MLNPRNWLKIELKVEKIRAHHIGQIKPAPMPAAIAIMIRGKSPILLNIDWRGVAEVSVMVFCLWVLNGFVWQK